MGEARSGDGEGSFFERGKTALLRILGHAGFLAASAFFTYFAGGGAFDWTALYLALVLLLPLPHGSLGNPLFKWPVLAGLAGAAGAFFAGVPWALAAFSGGIVTFAIRRIFYGGRHPWEWSALLGIALGLMWKRPELGTLLSPLPAGALAAALAGGCLLTRLGQRSEENKARLEFISGILDTFESASGDERLPQELRQAAGVLDKEFRALLKLAPELKAKSPQLEKASNIAVSLNLISGSTVGGSGGTFKSNTERNMACQALASGIREAAAQLAQQVRILSDAQPRHGTEEQSAEKKPQQPRDAFSEFDDKAQELLKLSARLPDDASAPLGRIVSAAAQIITRLREEPDSASAYMAFLRRYLKAALSVSRGYERLCKDPDASQTRQAALDRAEALLSRMASVFEEELKSIAENDTAEFDAELKSFDDFMDMQGRGQR